MFSFFLNENKVKFIPLCINIFAMLSSCLHYISVEFSKKKIMVNLCSISASEKNIKKNVCSI